MRRKQGHTWFALKEARSALTMEYRYGDIFIKVEASDDFD
jgi:hypothetical protein